MQKLEAAIRIHNWSFFFFAFVFCFIFAEDDKEERSGKDRFSSSCVHTKQCVWHTQ